MTGLHTQNCLTGHPSCHCSSLLHSVMEAWMHFAANYLTFSTLTLVRCSGTGFFVVGTLGGGRWGTSTGPACDP